LTTRTKRTYNGGGRLGEHRLAGEGGDGLVLHLRDGVSGLCLGLIASSRLGAELL